MQTLGGLIIMATCVCLKEKCDCLFYDVVTWDVDRDVSTAYWQFSSDDEVDWARVTHMLLYSSAAIGSIEAFVFFLFLTCLRICSDTLTVEYEAGVVGCQQSCSWRFKFQNIYRKLSFFWTPFLRETDFAIYTELVRCRIAVNSFLRDHRWSRKNCSFSGRRSLDLRKSLQRAKNWLKKLVHSSSRRSYEKDFNSDTSRIFAKWLQKRRVSVIEGS